MVKKQKPKRRKEKNPTIFAFEGSIRVFEEGSMLELHTQVTDQEWEAIVEETVKYKVFLECLKKIAIPALDEKWEVEDDWFRHQLVVAISRMKNIDVLLVAKFNQDDIRKEYEEMMETNVALMKQFIEDIRKTQQEILRANLEEPNDRIKSDL